MVVAAELQSPKMEIAKQRMHRSLRKDVEKRMVNLESSVQRGVQKFYAKLGKVAVMNFYVARGRGLIKP